MSVSHSFDDNKGSANLEKCLRSISFISNKISSIEPEIISGFHSYGLKEFHLTGFLKKLKGVEKTLMEIEDKIEKEKENRTIAPHGFATKAVKRPKIVTTPTMKDKEPKTLRKEVKKPTGRQKALAYKKIKDFAQKLQTQFYKKLAMVVKRIGATRVKPQPKPVERPFPKKSWNEVQSAPSIWELNYLSELQLKNVKVKNVNEMVTGLIKQSTKRIASTLANYESKCTMELRVIMLYGGVKLVSTAE